jgi:hypothetical protein
MTDPGLKFWPYKPRLTLAAIAAALVGLLLLVAILRALAKWPSPQSETVVLTHPSGSKIHFRSITCAIGRAKLCHRLTVCQNGWSSGTAHGERSRGCRFQSSITWGSAGLHRRFSPYTENLSKFDRQYGL